MNHHSRYTHTQQQNTTVTPYTVTYQRVNTKTKSVMTPGNAKMRPPQTEPHITPDDTEVLPTDMHPYNGKIFNTTPVHIYNTRSRHQKWHNLMEIHVTTTPLPRQMPTPAPTNMTLHQIGVDWVHTNSNTC